MHVNVRFAFLINHMAGSTCSPATGYTFTEYSSCNCNCCDDSYHCPCQHHSLFVCFTFKMYTVCHSLQHWTKLSKSGAGPWPGERNNHAACCLNYGQQHPHLLVTGGWDRQGKALADVWILDIDRGSWRKVRQWAQCSHYCYLIMYCYCHWNLYTCM